MACAGDDVGYVEGEAGAGSMEGSVDERPHVGFNRAAAASAGDSVVVFGVLMDGVEGC